MPVHQDTEYMTEIEDLTKYFENAKHDPSLLKKISDDPIGVLKSNNIHVEDEFKEAVISQLKLLSSTGGLHPHTIEADAMSAQLLSLSDSAPVVTPMSAPAAPSGLVITQPDKVPDTPPPEVLDAIQILVKPWGLVLVVREPAIKYLQGGGTISASVLGGIAALAGVTGPVGVAVGIIVGILAAALGIFSGVITITDQGKGVYLTWTWAQFLPWIVPPIIPNPMYGIPVVTPVK